MYEIRLHIHEEADLYNPLDPEHTLLSDEVVSYIVRRYDERPLGEEHIIRIISDEPVNEDRVRRNIVSYTTHEQDILKKEHRKASRKQIVLFAIGVVFIGAWLIISQNSDTIIDEVLSIIGSFSVWEAANIWIVEGPENRIERRRLERMKETRIEFSIASGVHADGSPTISTV